jgi:F-type H+-transporting ATPase subunit epsilon
MAKSFLLDVVTPEKRFYSGEVEIVIVRTLSGEEGFLANHVWAVKLLGDGEMRIRESGTGKTLRADISGGVIDVHDHILIYTDKAEWKEDSDQS